MENFFQEQMQLPSQVPQSSQIQSLMDNTFFALQGQRAISLSQVWPIFFVELKKEKKSRLQK
jgi:hypothetical protein